MLWIFLLSVFSLSVIFLDDLQFEQIAIGIVFGLFGKNGFFLLWMYGACRGRLLADRIFRSDKSGREFVRSYDSLMVVHLGIQSKDPLNGMFLSLLFHWSGVEDYLLRKFTDEELNKIHTFWKEKFESPARNRENIYGLMGETSLVKIVRELNKIEKRLGKMK